MKPVLRWLWLVALLLLAACGSSDGGDTAPPPPASGFELTLEAPALALPRGGGTLLGLRIDRAAGFVAPVRISLVSPPEGVRLNGLTLDAATDGAVTLAVSGDVAVGELRLSVQATGGGVTRTAALRLTVQDAQPPTQTLIAQALSEGRIDLGTSLLYRAYAAFGDDRLPSAYVGAGPVEEDGTLPADIAAALAGLTADQQAALLPFTVRPNDPRSFASRLAGVPTSTGRESAQAAAGPSEACSEDRREWISRRSETIPVRVWVACVGGGRNDASEADLAVMLDAMEQIYKPMTDLMGPPIADVASTPNSVSPDAAIDIYVVPRGQTPPRSPDDANIVQGVRGVTFATAPFADTTSSGYIQMPEWRVREDDFQVTLIHEFFHVLQFRHNYSLQPWFTEASATWASVHFNRKIPVRPAQNAALHRSRFLGQGGRPAQDGKPAVPPTGFQHRLGGLLDLSNDAAYDSYAWPLFMEQRTGGPQSIAQAWTLLKGVATPPGADSVLNAVLPYKENFRKFAVRNLNLDLQPGDPIPKAQRYVSLDEAFPDGSPPAYPKRVTLRPEEDLPLFLPAPLKPLSAGYIQVEVPSDPRIQQVVIDLKALERDGLDVDAVFKINGIWESAPRDLNETQELRFCIGRPTEKLEQAWLVFSHHRFEEGRTAPVDFLVRTLETPCKAQLRGNSSAVIDGGLLGRYEYDASDVIWEQSDTLSTERAAVFLPVSGTVRFRQILTGCTVTAEPSTFQISPNDFDGQTGTTGSVTINYANDPPTYGGSAATTWFANVTADCPGGAPSTVRMQVGIGGWFGSPPGDGQTRDLGTLIQDGFTSGDTSFNYRFEVIP